MKKLETSKLILCASWAAAVTLTVIVIDGTYRQIDVSNILPLALEAWAALAVAHAFYFWKAKCENRAKGAQKLIRDLAEKYGADVVAQLAEIIFRD